MVRLTITRGKSTLVIQLTPRRYPRIGGKVKLNGEEWIIANVEAVEAVLRGAK